MVSVAFAASNCRTRSADEIAKASTGRVVFSPAVRKGSAVSNTFFASAEFAGLLGDKRSLKNVLPCIVTPAEKVGSSTTFIASTTGISDEIIPASHDCFDDNGVEIKTLKDVAGELFIVVHGHPKFPRVELGFGPGGIEGRKMYSPDEMAELLVKEGLACDQRKITLIILTGGMELSKASVDKRYIELYRKMQATKKESEHIDLINQWGDLAIRAKDPKTFEQNIDIEEEAAPFATLLAVALHQRGFLDATVTGFRAPVRTRIGLNPTNPGPYAGLQVQINAKRLATRYCKTVAKTVPEIQDCVDKLLAPCDECMLANANTPLNYVQRLAACRKTLRKGNRAQKRSASICKAHTAFVTSKWTFSVHSGDAADIHGDLS